MQALSRTRKLKKPELAALTEKSVQVRLQHLCEGRGNRHELPLQVVIVVDRSTDSAFGLRSFAGDQVADQPPLLRRGQQGSCFDVGRRAAGVVGDGFSQSLPVHEFLIQISPVQGSDQFLDVELDILK